MPKPGRVGALWGLVDTPPEDLPLGRRNARVRDVPAEGAPVDRDDPVAEGEVGTRRVAPARERPAVPVLDLEGDRKAEPSAPAPRVDGWAPPRPEALGRARAPRLADTAAAAAPGVLRDRARAEEPVSPLVAIPRPLLDVAARGEDVPKPREGEARAPRRAAPPLREEAPPGRERAAAPRGTAPLVANAAAERSGRCWNESATRRPEMPRGFTRRLARPPRPRSPRRTTFQPPCPMERGTG